jgi:hypothetical protein
MCDAFDCRAATTSPSAESDELMDFVSLRSLSLPPLAAS